jgi:hypothetical protein
MAGRLEVVRRVGGEFDDAGNLAAEKIYGEESHVQEMHLKKGRAKFKGETTW